MASHPYLVGIIKHLGNAAAFGVLAVAHQAFSADDLHKGEAAVQANSRRQRSFASARRTLQEASQQRRLLAVPYLKVYNRYFIAWVMVGRTTAPPVYLKQLAQGGRMTPIIRQCEACPHSALPSFTGWQWVSVLQAPRLAEKKYRFA